MGSNVVRKNARAALIAASMIGLSLVSAGCQDHGSASPLHLSIVSDQATPEHIVAAGKDSPYVNPDWHESEDSSSGLFITILSQTGSAIGSIFTPVVDLGSKTIRFFSDDRPVQATALMQDRNSADNRREGINKMADFGFLGSEPFRKECRLMAQRDPDATVRATAIRTSNRARDPLATPVFIGGLSDQSQWVRLEAAKALINVPDLKATDPLAQVLGKREEDRDIRLAAADALKHYRTMPAARALTLALDDKNFAISWQARRSLRYLTDRDFGYDASAWLGYFSGPENPLR